MITKVQKLLGLFLLVTVLMTACSPAVTPTVAPTKEAAPTQAPAVVPTEAPAVEAAAAAGLKIDGKVGEEKSWKEEEIKAMTTMDVEATNKSGQKSTYTGVLLKSLLDIVKPASDATTLVLVADDGFTAEIPLKDAVACENCIVSFRDKGGFSLVAPNFDNKAQVKGLVEIQVK